MRHPDNNQSSTSFGPPSTWWTAYAIQVAVSLADYHRLVVIPNRSSCNTSTLLEPAFSVLAL
jgi:hypothetical protein